MVSAVSCAERDAEFFVRLLKAENVEPDDSAVFKYFGQSLGDRVHFKAEGGISSEGGGTSWVTLVKRRIVEGGYLIESTVRSHPGPRKGDTLALPVIVTWYDGDSFPAVPWRRAIVTERDGSPVVIERWSGVMWFSDSEPKIQWTRYAAVQETRGGPPDDRRALQSRTVGAFIGTAMEDLNTDGFPTVFTIEPDGEGLEAWKETRWK